jgi:glycosyltransferase involved in cell wall biosynthesis
VATDDVDALLVEPGDADELGAALRRATTDQVLAQRLRRAGDSRAEGFAMTALTDRYLEIYRSICPSSG